MKPLDEFIKNGTLDSRRDSDYDGNELLNGIEIEHEHTDCPIKAKIIAKDHLDEIPDYYSRLMELEDEAKEEYVDMDEDYEENEADKDIAGRMESIVDLIK